MLSLQELFTIYFGYCFLLIFSFLFLAIKFPQLLKFFLKEVFEMLNSCPRQTGYKGYLETHTGKTGYRIVNFFRISDICFIQDKNLGSVKKIFPIGSQLILNNLKVGLHII